MGFMDEINKEAGKYGAGKGSTDYFEFDGKGVYKMRLLVQPKVIAYHFPPKGRPDVCVGIEEGCPHHGTDAKSPTIRLVTYIIDRKDGKVKRAELPLSVSYSINKLQEDEDFAFSEFPMPYDIKIDHDPDNSDPKMKYTVTPSPKQEELTNIEEAMLEEAMAKETPEQYVDKKKRFQKGPNNVTGTPKYDPNRPVDYPKGEISPDDIPF